MSHSPSIDDTLRTAPGMNAPSGIPSISVSTGVAVIRTLTIKQRGEHERRRVAGCNLGAPQEPQSTIGKCCGAWTEYRTVASGFDEPQRRAGDPLMQFGREARRVKRIVVAEDDQRARVYARELFRGEARLVSIS